MRVFSNSLFKFRRCENSYNSFLTFSIVLKNIKLKKKIINNPSLDFSTFFIVIKLCYYKSFCHRTVWDFSITQTQ